MSSKLVTDRQKTSLLVEAALHTHGAAAARAFADKLQPREGVEARRAAMELLLEELRSQLGRAREQLVLADEANVAELGDDLVPRQSRDSWAREVYRSVCDLRTTIDGIYGAGTSAKILGIEGRTAQDPVILHRQGERLVSRCLDPEASWPSSRYGSFHFSPTVAAEELSPKVEALGDALERVATERRKAEATLGAKLAALDTFDQTYRGVASVAKGVFTLADFQDLAERLRPPRRKPTASLAGGEEGDAALQPPSFELAGPPVPVALPSPPALSA